MKNWHLVAHSYPKVYMIMVKWSDQSEKLIYRKYPEIHIFHVSPLLLNIHMFCGKWLRVQYVRVGNLVCLYCFMQKSLKEMFPIEAGDIDPKDRIIPTLPGKSDSHLSQDCIFFFCNQIPSASFVYFKNKEWFVPCPVETVYSSQVSHKRVQ